MYECEEQKKRDGKKGKSLGEASPLVVVRTRGETETIVASSTAKRNGASERGSGESSGAVGREQDRV